MENDLSEGLSVYHAQYLDSYEGVIIILLLVLQLIFALFALVLNFKKKLLPGLIIALLAPVVLLILHYGTGFSYAESTITDGSDLSAENIEFFLKVNIPYHIVYSLFYGTSAIWLYFQRK